MSEICSECGEPCRAHAVNFGIGPYEFWGQKGNDVRMAVVSTCCDAPIEDEDGKPIEEYEDPREAQADRIADERRDRELEWDRSAGT